MPSGVSLGSAYFTIDASSAGLIQALNQAEQQSKKSVAAISAAIGVEEKDVQRLAQTWVRSEKQRADASAAAALKIIRAYNDAGDAADRAAKQTQDAAGGFAGFARGALGVTSALTGITVSAAAVGEAIRKVASDTREAEQAQFALNALYGDAAPVITAFAEKQAQAFGRSKTDAKEAAAQVATLSRNYALTGDQIQKVLTISANLAAVRGISLADAAERTQSALRGEAEAIEYLGIAVQSNALKALANMTAAERAHFETLSDITKAQIILNAIQDQSADLQGKAAQRANTLGGSFDKLNASITDLSATIGGKLAPSIVTANNATADLVKGLDGVVQRTNIDGVLSLAGAFAAMASPLALIAAIVHGDLAQAIVNIARIAGALPTPSLPFDPRQQEQGPHEDPDIANRRKQAAAKRRDEIRAELEDAQKAHDREAEAAIRAIDKERAAKEKWYDEERQRIEARRAHQIEAITTTRDLAIKALEDERDAQKAADEQAIKDSDRRREAELSAVDQAHDQVIAAIKARSAELKRARELEDRDTSDSRERADRTLSDFRAYQDRSREADHQKELRRIEARHTAAVRAFEVEAAAERKKSDQASRNLDRQAQKEDDRHRKAIANIDAESKAQIDAIQQQIDALDAAQQSDENAGRIANLQKAVADAQVALRTAQGTGTPAQIAAARGDLTTALRVPGNEIGVANARERLQQLAGQGADAIKKANEDLQKALSDLQAEQTKEARDAEKDRLKATQDRIKAQADGEKAAEDDRDRGRQAELSADKQAESDKLADHLAKLEKRKQAEADAHDKRVSDVNDEYKQDSERLATARLEQDRAIADRRQAEDRDRSDRRDAEDAALAHQTEAADKARAEERNAVQQHYDGPNGVTIQLKEAARQHDLEYSRMLAAEKAAYDAELTFVNNLYHNADGTGMLDQLAAARAAEIDTLNASKESWRDWQTEVSRRIKDALDDLDEFIRRGGGGIPGVGGSINPGGGVGNTPYGRNVPGGGPPASGGGGDLDSWLSAAIQRTGVPDSWMSGLKGIVARESSGNPGAKSPYSTASGLFQLIDTTWAAYRDKSLSSNVFDPVANSVAGINYIRKRYGSPEKAIAAWEANDPHWYARGGWITEPVVGRGLSSGAAYMIGEAGPEYVSPGRYASSASLLGPGPGSGYGAMAAQMSLVHPGAGGGYREGDINVYGAGTEDVLVKLRSEQRRASLLRGGKAVRRR